MPRPFRKLVRRVTNTLAAPYMLELRTGIAELNGRVEHLQASLGPIHGDIRDVVARHSEAEISELRLMQRMLRRLDDETAANRRRLYELRAGADYELAFTEPDPLVSFVLPTHRRFEKLRDVALPSILGQTHANVEIVVV